MTRAPSKIGLVAILLSLMALPNGGEVGLGSRAAANLRKRPRRFAPKARAARPFRSQMATSMDRAALRLLRRGHHERALRLWRQALRRYRRRYGRLHRRVLKTERRVALLSYALGRYAIAERHFRQLLRARRRRAGRHQRLLARALRDLGTVLAAKGEYQDAERRLREALALYEKAGSGQTRSLALVLSDLGGVLCEQRRYVKARPLLERALKIQRGKPTLPAADLALVLNNLGVVRRAGRQWTRARRLFDRALALLRSREPRTMALTPPLSNLALLAHARGQYGEAERLLREVLAIQRKHLPPVHPAIATTWLNLAWMAMADLRPSRGVAAAVKGLALRERFLALIVASGAEAQKLAYLKKVRSEQDFVLSLYFSHQTAATAHLALETTLRRKGRVLDAVAAGMRSMRRGLDPVALRLFRRLRRLRGRTARRVLAGWRRPGRVGRRSLERLLERTRALERRLAARSAAYRSRTAPITVERVRAALPSDAALVEVVWYRPLRPRALLEARRWGEPRYAAAVLRARSEVSWVDLGPAARIDRGLRRLRRALGSGGASRDFVRSRGRYLYRRLIEPLGSHLAGVRMLYWSPDGALNLLPLAALVNGRGRYLIEDRTFTLVSSGRDLVGWRGPRPRAEGALLVADPTFGPAPDGVSIRPGAGRRSAALGSPRFAPLPGTRAEGEALSSLLPGIEKLWGAAASEEALKKARAPAILHIATHGFFIGARSKPGPAGPGTPEEPGFDVASENPLLHCGLALAGANRLRSGAEDGILTALELTGLDLGSTGLVVLSACETGVGDVSNGEGVFGLRRALVIAGAQSQVLSLWKVDDKATGHLMVAFYQRLRAGHGPAQALREAQLALLHGPRWPHPSYWAAFVPSGRPTPLVWWRRPAVGGK